MSPQKQRIAIAEACGWQKNPDGGKWKSPYARSFYKWRRESSHGIHTFINDCHLPDYLNDLNAMHEAEKVLHVTQLPAYFIALMKVVLGKVLVPDNVTRADLMALTTATATQRAEAFLRTLNLLTD
jgi:hypothetical protein